MKKLLVLFLFAIISTTLWSQNEFKYPVYAGGLKIGEKPRWVDLSQVDSMNIVDGELIFYVGDIEYTAIDSLFNGNLYLNGDLDVTGKIETPSFTTNPYGTYDFADYYDSDINFYTLKSRIGSVNVTGANDYHNKVFSRIDTLNIQGVGNRTIGYDYAWVVINSEVPYTPGYSEAFAKGVYHNNFQAPGKDTWAFSFTDRIEQLVITDTVEIDDQITMSVSAQTYTPTASRIDIREQSILDISGTYDNEIALDSMTAIRVKLYNNGIPADSIKKVFVIKNLDEGLRGSDSTYFLYSEYGDNYLNGDVSATNFKYNYPNPINMSEYYRDDASVYSWVYTGETKNVNLVDGGVSMGILKMDTVNITSAEDIDGPLYYEYNHREINADTTYQAGSFRAITDYVEQSNFEGPSTYLQGYIQGHRFNPQANDTIHVDIWVPNSINAEVFTPESTSRVKVGEERILQIFGSYDNEMAVDSTTALFIRQRNDGIPDDSIDAVYGIYNLDGGLRGKDRTYFLYSEYGDNYLNGDLDVTGTISGNLATDPIYEADYFVATWGDDGNDGSFTSPWATWNYAFNQLSAGDTLYIRGGVYYPTGVSGSYCIAGVNVSYRDGTEENRICVFNYPGETPILDGSLLTQNDERHGIDIVECQYWHLKGLTVRNVYQNNGDDFSSGIWLGKSGDIIFENMVSYQIGGVGFYSNVWSAADDVGGNKWINCDSYDNYDPYTSPAGGDADGWDILDPYNLNDSTTFIGCRAWGNSDDGFDGWGTEGVIVYQNCWSFNNGVGGGDGNGIKLGKADSIVNTAEYVRYVYNCISFGNRNDGIPENGTDGRNWVVNNTIYKNRNVGLTFNGEDTTSIYRNNIIWGNSDNIYLVGTNTQRIIDHNSYDADYQPNGPVASAADFFSLDSMQLYGDRKYDGSLPDITFGTLRPESDLVEAGIDVGLDYHGFVPDIGAIESFVTANVPAASITIASVNATAAQIATATYVCDGTDDQVQWALANTAATATYQTVQLLGTVFDISDTITLTSHFRGQSNVHHTDGDIEVADDEQIILHSPGNLSNMRIWSDTRTTRLAVVQMEVKTGLDSYDSQTELFDGVFVRSYDWTGVGMKIYAEATEVADFNYFSFCEFGDIAVMGFETNIIIDAHETAGSAFINSNVFKNLELAGADTMMILQTDDGDVGMNIFYGINMQFNVEEDNTVQGVYCNDGAGIGWNHFLSVQAMDWGAGIDAVHFSASTQNNYAIGTIPEFDTGGSAATNENSNSIKNIWGGNPDFPNGDTLTVSDGEIYLNKGQAVYWIEGQGAASDFITTIGGLSSGESVRLKVATAGQVITISDWMNYITTDYVLEDTDDYIELLCVGRYDWVVSNYYQHQGAVMKTTTVTIGVYDEADCDVNFADNANQTAQNNLLTQLPYGVRVTAIEMVCVTALAGSGTTDLTVRYGSASAGEQFIADASCDDLNEVAGIINPDLPAVVPMLWKTKRDIYLGATPSANWSTYTAGKWKAYITFIDYRGGWNH